ncbi:hypothetical protein [Maricaulis maris]|uniref:hypothetical protein n=1 Tax=Maricaulis maris TaxID=74318 RepID=UPI003B8BE3F9
MILARITKAIREQNWFAVAVEFLIVILGVVIGFQVTAWNAERAEAIRTSVLIERVEEEFLISETHLSDYLHFLTAYEAASENVIAAIRNDAVATTEPALMREWLGLTRHVGRPPARSAVFAEMIASGELSLLPEELRTALSQFDQEIQRNAYLWPEAANHLTGSRALFDAVEYNSLRAESRVNAYDPDLLPLAESELEALVIYQGALRITYEQALQSVRAILAATGRSREED